MAQIVSLARGALHSGAVLFKCRARSAPGVPQRFDRADVLFESRERIEQPPMRGRIHQRALVMLAMDFDQGRAKGFQSLNADGLIVEKGTGAPVGKLNAAQDQIVLGVDPLVLQKRTRRMSGGLGTCAYTSI